MRLAWSILQAAAFAAEHMHPDAHLVIGGDFNSLWRKYTSDEYDKVSHCHFCTGCPDLISSDRMPFQEGSCQPSAPCLDK